MSGCTATPVEVAQRRAVGSVAAKFAVVTSLLYVVVEVEESVAGEDFEAGCCVEDDVDEWLGAFPVGWGGDRGDEDCVDGVESALIACSGHGVSEGVVAVQVASCFEVFVGFGFDGQIKDPFHLGSTEWVATGSVHRDGAVIDAH